MEIITPILSLGFRLLKHKIGITLQRSVRGNEIKRNTAFNELKNLLRNKPFPVRGVSVFCKTAKY
jgi:hypothetical protein